MEIVWTKDSLIADLEQAKGDADAVMNMLDNEPLARAPAINLVLRIDHILTKLLIASHQDVLKADGTSI